MDGMGNNISINRNVKRLAIETRKTIQPHDTIPVYLSAVSLSNNYKLFINLSELNVGAQTTVLLKDAFTHSEIVLNKGGINSYSFQPSATTMDNRFSIVLET